MFPAVAQGHPCEHHTRWPDWTEVNEHFRKYPRRCEGFAVPETEDVIEQSTGARPVALPENIGSLSHEPTEAPQQIGAPLKTDQRIFGTDLKAPFEGSHR